MTLTEFDEVITFTFHQILHVFLRVYRGVYEWMSLATHFFRTARAAGRPIRPALHYDFCSHCSSFTSFCFGWRCWSTQIFLLVCSRKLANAGRALIHWHCVHVRLYEMVYPNKSRVIDIGRRLHDKWLSIRDFFLLLWLIPSAQTQARNFNQSGQRWMIDAIYEIGPMMSVIMASGP